MQALSGRLAEHEVAKENYYGAFMLIILLCVLFLIFLCRGVQLQWSAMVYLVFLALLVISVAWREILVYKLTWELSCDCEKNFLGRKRHSLPLSQVCFSTRIDMPLCAPKTRLVACTISYFLLSDRSIPFFWHISGPAFGSLLHFWKRRLILIPATEETRDALV